MAEISTRASFDYAKDWLDANQEQVKCYSFATADLLFASWLAIRSANPKDPVFWKAFEMAANATAALWACSMPEGPIFEEWYTGENKKCQCVEVSGQLFVEYNDVTGNRIREAQSEPGQAKNIQATGTADGYLSCTWDMTDGMLNILQIPAEGKSRPLWYIVPEEGTDCCEGSPNVPHIPPSPGPWEIGDYEARCGAKVTLIDSCIDTFGLVQNFYYVDMDTNNCGGRPLLYHYWESVRGPYIYVGLDRVFQGAISDPEYGPPHPDAAPCPCSSEAPKDEKPKLEGAWVTTRWISDQKMEHSGRRLRKLFRYRSKGGRFLPELTAWWANFQWEAGDVCVRHNGAWWGNPQVWAKDEAEGKRVIRFAGSEAGIDPDKDGQWAVSSSSSPRYGMSGTMIVHMKDGFPWVAQRPGPNFPNLLAQPVDP